MSEEGISSTGVHSNYEGSDQDYFESMTGGKQQPAKAITPAILEEIEHVTTDTIIPFEPGSYEYKQAALGASRSCPFCDYECANYVDMRQHLSRHPQVRSFLQLGSKRLQRLEEMHERRQQLGEAAERLEGERRQLERELREYDVDDQLQSDCQRLNKALYGY